MSDSSQFVADLVAECIARREREGDAVVDALCAAHPEHADVVRRRLRRLADMGLLAEPDAPDAPARAAAAPERIGGYRLLRRLGEGGMGVVHLARHERLERLVALKLVRSDQLWFPGARERFEREAEVVAALAHPGIVPVFEVGEDAGVPWLAMEYVDGATLDAVLRAVAGRDPAELRGEDLRAAVTEVARPRRAVPVAEAEADAPAAAPGDAPAGGTPPPPRAARRGSSAHGDTTRRARLFEGSWADAAFRIVAEVAEALAHAHAQGVLHRDLKPSNIVVGVDGRVRLLDFGLASRDGSARLTVTGQLVGSLAYLPPERLRDDGPARDPRSDVYGLGATLFELLTLRTPFVAGSNEGLRRAILEGRAPSPRLFHPPLSRDAEAVCLVALDPDLARRYASAEALAADARRVLAGEPVLARPPSRVRRAASWARRKPFVAACAGLALVLLVGGPAAWALLSARHARELGAQLEETRLQRDEAAAQRARAEGNLDLARQAVDTLLLELSDETLDDVPGVEQLRVDLREAALAFYEPILEQRPAEPELLLRRLDVLRNLGAMEGALGRREAALAAFAQLEREARELLARDAWSAEQRRSLRRLLFAGQYGSIDVNALLAGEPQAVARAREALATARARAADPADERAAYDVADVLGTLAGVLTDSSSDAEVTPLFEEALGLLAGMPELEPDGQAVLTRRMELLYSLARHLSLLDDPPAARHLDLVRRAAEVQAEVRRRYAPDAVPHGVRSARALLLSALADAVERLGSPRDAEALRRASLADSEAVVAAAPAVFLPLVFLASTTHELAMQLHGEGRRAEAVELLRDVLPRMDAARARWPEMEQLRGAAAVVRGRLGLLLPPDAPLDELRAVVDPLAALVAERPGTPPADGHPVIAAALERWAAREGEQGEPVHAGRAADALAALRAAPGPGE